MSESLQDLRKSIDNIDEQIHELLIKRATIVQKVGEYKKQNNASVKNNIRIDRECDILSRLIKRHKGDFPLDSLIRIWREIISASLRIEGDLKISTLKIDSYKDVDLHKLIHEFFGTYPETAPHPSTWQALKQLDDDNATVCVIPFSNEIENNSFWANLSSNLKIVTRLPLIKDFSKSTIEAFVVSKGEYKKTLNDVTLIKSETKKSMSKTSLKDLVVKHGFDFISFEDAYTFDNRNYNLISVNGFIDANDEKLKAIIEENPQITNMEIIGWYPVIK
ncbi:MAG: hypothetical protein BWY78_01074 [Alphaproteobacteria bacterium ADurb.Bin438]|nr:MAG: hypothetical protein BWY78_01074 [Alphaproteobacteria bacterium ADurb.Bin438]